MFLAKPIPENVSFTIVTSLHYKKYMTGQIAKETVMTEWHMIAAVAAATVAVVGIVLTVISVAYKLGERKGEANADRKL